VATPVEGLAVGAAFDYRNNGGANLLGSVNNYAWALAGYVTFQASEKWKLAGRYDFTQASAGTWFNSTGNPNYGGNPTDTQKLAALTLTADYSLWENVITRAEFRWDHSATGQSPFGESGGNPAGNKDAYTLAANVIYKF
jgi:hypothetical protein